MHPTRYIELCIRVAFMLFCAILCLGNAKAHAGGKKEN
jgi:hypothetical protein